MRVSEVSLYRLNEQRREGQCSLLSPPSPEPGTSRGMRLVFWQGLSSLERRWWCLGGCATGNSLAKKDVVLFSKSASEVLQAYKGARPRQKTKRSPRRGSVRARARARFTSHEYGLHRCQNLKILPDFADIELHGRHAAVVVNLSLEGD